MPRSSGWYVVLPFLLLGCEGDDPDPGPGPEPPHTASIAWTCDADTDTVPDDIATMLSGDAVLEREIHDCQRMIEGDAYGSLVGVFPYKPTLPFPADSFATWRLVATLYNWGRRDGAPPRYEPLALEANLNCLYLKRSDDEWRGLMVAAQACRTRLTQIGGGVELHAVAQEYVGSDTALPDRPIYPGTARFRWDARTGQYTVGVKCADRWCTVGGETALATLTDLNGPLLETMPGYFDEQPLAAPSSNGLVPGPLARIYPVDTLRLANAASPAEDFWSRLTTYAVLEIEPHPNYPERFAAYVDKFGLVVDTARVARAHLRMRMPVEDGGGAPPEAPVAQFVSFGQTAATKNAVSLDRVANARHSADGTVRWRWLEEDEAAWVPCQGLNCCTGTW